MTSAVAELHWIAESADVILSRLNGHGTLPHVQLEPGVKTIEAPSDELVCAAEEAEQFAQEMICSAATISAKLDVIRDAILEGTTSAELDEEIRTHLAEAWARAWDSRRTPLETANWLLRGLRRAGRPDPAWNAELLRAAHNLMALHSEVIGWPESAFSVHVSWRAYVRTMWNLFRSALFHPRSTTTIDLVTGEIISRE